MDAQLPKRRGPGRRLRCVALRLVIDRALTRSTRTYCEYVRSTLLARTTAGGRAGGVRERSLAARAFLEKSLLPVHSFLRSPVSQNKPATSNQPAVLFSQNKQHQLSTTRQPKMLRSPLGFRPCCSLFCRTPNAATAMPFSVRAPSKLASGGPWLAGARGERCMHTFGTGAPRPYPTQPDPIRSIWISACPQQGNMHARTPGGTGG
jgi:hypothetical protein